ncbi:hypothetical protein M9H77_31113 [Catharanthus roseus]|uniref:Uncharacterized protein n=1 Tax=Catharanthus roseus TaxID=4058 RepID=A0ACC0A325_CATRO|nr:hypothetical protein M9H77_31113 [Catharanthus roseus]
MTEIMGDTLAPLGAIWCTAFDCRQLPTHTLVTYRDQLHFMPSDQFARAQMVPDVVDTCLDLHQIQLRGNDNTSWVTQHAIHVDIWNQWQVRVRDGPAVEYDEALSYPSDEYIRWYRGITRTSMLQEVDDMASVVIREPPSSLSQIAAHDIQTTFPVQPSRRCPREHVPDRGARGVKRGARRHPGQGVGRNMSTPTQQWLRGVRDLVGGGRHVDSPHLDMPSYSLGLAPDPESLPSGFGTSQMPSSPSSGFTQFQSLHPSACGFGRLRAPPPPCTAGASTPHQPISQAYWSDEEEGQDVLGLGHRVGKKTVRFTPSDWP